MSWNESLSIHRSCHQHSPWGLHWVSHYPKFTVLWGKLAELNVIWWVCIKSKMRRVSVSPVLGIVRGYSWEEMKNAIRVEDSQMITQEDIEVAFSGKYQKLYPLPTSHHLPPPRKFHQRVHFGWNCRTLTSSRFTISIAITEILCWRFFSKNCELDSSAKIEGFPHSMALSFNHDRFPRNNWDTLYQWSLSSLRIFFCGLLEPLRKRMPKWYAIYYSHQLNIPNKTFL